MPTDAELLAKFNITAQYTKYVPEDQRKPWIGALVDDVLQKHGHLFFGEPHVNGAMLKTYQMLSQNPDIFTAAAKNGARHLVLEFPDALQRHLDDYASHKTSRDDLHYYLFQNPFTHFTTFWLAGEAETQFRRDFIQTVDNALAAGLSVHFADVSWKTFLSAVPQEFLDLRDTLTARHKEEKSPLSLLEYMAAFDKSLPPEEQQRLLKVLSDFEKVKRANRMDDTAQYNYLRSRIPAGEGMIGVVGMSHLDDSAGKDAGINSWLRREGAKVATIEIYDGSNTQAYVAESYAATGQLKRIQPDYTIFLEEDALLAKGGKTASRPSSAFPAGGSLPKPPLQDRC